MTTLICNILMSLSLWSTFCTHRQYGLHSHLSRLKTHIRGIPPYCHYVVGPESLFLWPAQISVSVWIFKSAFRIQPQVSYMRCPENSFLNHAVLFLLTVEFQLIVSRWLEFIFTDSIFTFNFTSNSYP